MLNLRKKTLALAVAAAAALGGGVSAVQAQTVSPNGLGQVLIYPYFTVRDGWRTFVHVTNTSGFTVAAKVRFHAAKGSEDLLDFLVVLSPNDMWTAVVEERGGVPGVRPTDNSCTVPTIGIGVFQPVLTDRVEATDDAREGYAEIIAMGVAIDNNSDLALAAKHGRTSGVPADCDLVEGAFGGAGIEETRLLFNPPENVLAGKFDLINTLRAYAGASRAVAIADFTDGNIVYGQYPAEWDYPNLANSATEAPLVPDPADAAAVNDALNAVSISNEWVLNPGLNELSSWVVTFPTKYLIIDQEDTDPPTEGLFAPFNGITGSACPSDYQEFAVPVRVGLFNREERSQSDVGLSPGTSAAFCYETNVINFISGGITSAGLLNSVVSKTVNTSVLQSPFLGGWASVTYADRPNEGPTPLPAIGFNLTARSNADGDSAVLYDHVYDGRAPQAPVPPYVAPPPP
jgi:hypothetical protein